MLMNGNKTVLGLFSAVWLFSAPVMANNCNDEDENKKWAETAQNSINDHLLLRLYAVRVGICHLIASGEIDERRAIDLFEITRQDAIAQRKRETAFLNKKEGQPL